MGNWHYSFSATRGFRRILAFGIEAWELEVGVVDVMIDGHDMLFA